MIDALEEHDRRKDARITINLQFTHNINTIAEKQDQRLDAQVKGLDRNLNKV